MGAGRLITYSVLFFINFMILILFAFNNPNVFLIELIFIALTLLMAFMVVLGENKESSWVNGFAAFFFILNLLNVVYLYFKITAYLLIALLVVHIVGYIMSVTGKKKEKEEETEEPEEIKLEEYSKEDDIEKELKEFESATPEIVVEDEEPGFVASRRGSVFHRHSCDLARRIGGDNRVVFDSEKEAKIKGYKPHNCVKGPLI